MGIRDWFAPKASSTPVDVAKIATSAELADLLGMSGFGDVFSGETVTAKTALKVSAVYRCVEILSELAATAPIHIVNRTTLERRPVDDDIVWLLNGRANSKMTSYSLRKLMETHRLLSGNGYARIVRGAGSRPIALEFMHSSAVTVDERSDGAIEYTYANKRGGSIVLPQRDVLHIMGTSSDGISGRSVLESARNQVGFSIASERHASSLFKNGTNIGDVLTSDKTIGPDGVEFLRASLDKFRGAENGHKTLILQDGLKYDKVGMSQADAEFVESRKLGIIEICMFFGVPPHIVGYTENQTSYGQGVEHQGIAFTNFRVGPLYTSWEATILHALISGRREKVEFDESKLMRGDVKSRWAAHKIAREAGVVSANEIRRQEGMTDLQEGGNEIWMQPNAAKEAENVPDTEE